jgi:peptide chain release factor 3
VNNFGIELLLDGFLKDSVPPAPRRNAATARKVQVAADNSPAPWASGPSTSRMATS